ncbi:FAD:protein FMN transferase [Mitsuaria sp. GD03876]|uniref:FAD:protein FMN transferase n=1 Tax=Mitsuaria sp. GD03876 TaxID=2975399 RepID=UPI00244BD7ED|nr:FAD:protein FMN transferase [Mitsuaria sp. GD03876]MDH0864002.1 FAD:protein FMN transferase [Mitsuaria sp. GD03876]
MWSVHRRAFTAMASPNEVVLGGVPSAVAEDAFDAVEAEVRRIEQKYSRYREDSVVSAINTRAGRGGLTVDAETAQLLDFAAELHRQSDGLFDITSGCLRRAWDFKAGREPSPDALAVVLARIGWDRVQWDGRAIALPACGMEIDFGGIGKEYAADRAVAALQALGLKHGFVNLGGDLRVLGPRPDDQPWVFAVRHPRREDEVCARIPLSEGALATSGDYERFFIAPDGRRCCHILDPRTGQPVRHWQAVSVVAPLCVAAGALATMSMLIGASAPSRLSTPGVGFLLVDADGQVRTHDLDRLIHPPPSP